jgi:RNAse (barnase) inhibitor barstar
MKKVAVCISGQFRTFDRCIPSIFDNLILTNTKFELKFFTSFAKEEKTPITIPVEFFEMSSTIKIEEDPILPDLSFQKKKYVHESFILNSETDPKIIYYQLNQIHSVYNLVKEYEVNNNMVFDYIMRLRPDLEIKSPFNWDLLENEILLPLEHSFEGYNDRFAVGPRHLMDIYMTRLNYWLSKSDEHNFTTHNETNLKNHLDNYNVSVKKIPINLQYVRFNNYNETKLKISNISEKKVDFINVTDDILPIKVKICCGEKIVYSENLELSKNTNWYAGSGVECVDKKVIFQGKDLYLQYQMN